MQHQLAKTGITLVTAQVKITLKVNMRQTKNLKECGGNL
jgi:hypothetical protein